VKSRHRLLGLISICVVTLGLSGCGGGVPETGARAELPPDYKVREKEISDGFKAMMKQQMADKQKKSR